MDAVPAASRPQVHNTGRRREGHPTAIAQGDRGMLRIASALNVIRVAVAAAAAPLSPSLSLALSFTSLTIVLCTSFSRLHLGRRRFRPPIITASAAIPANALQNVGVVLVVVAAVFTTIVVVLAVAVLVFALSSS